MNRGNVVYVVRSVFHGSSSLMDQMSMSSSCLKKMTTYRHYGIYIGRNKVIHFSGESIAKAKIIKTSCDEFKKTEWFGFLTGGTDKIEKDYRITTKYGKEEIVKRAISKLNTDFGGYDLLDNNCEHFASWCAQGKRSSRQVGFRNDDQDIVEKAIDRTFDPLINLCEKIDDFFGW